VGLSSVVDEKAAEKVIVAIRRRRKCSGKECDNRCKDKAIVSFSQRNAFTGVDESHIQ
jgi:hypothetical protein